MKIPVFLCLQDDMNIYIENPKAPATENTLLELISSHIKVVRYKTNVHK